MRRKQSWALLALLVGACAIPDIEIDESLGDTGGSTGSGDEGGESTRGGSKGSNGKAGSPNPTGGVAGESSLGGETGLAGEDSVGGSNPTGGSRPMGGTGGSGVPPEPAVAKFCNEVTIDGQAVEMDLRIGSGADLVHIISTTGTCQPVVNHDCASIPTGAEVPVDVYDLAGNPLWTAMVEIVPGEAWLFTFYFDQTEQMVAFAAATGTAAECAATDFSDVFPGAT